MTSVPHRSHRREEAAAAERVLWDEAAAKGGPAGAAPWTEPSTRGVRSTETKPTRLHHFFERSCDLTPDAQALHADGRAYTYAELDELANRLPTCLMRSTSLAASRPLNSPTTRNSKEVVAIAHGRELRIWRRLRSLQY